METEYDFLVYKNDTWGSYGQHDKIVTIVIDVEKQTQRPLWEVLNVKWENNDSRKNAHRKAYTSQAEIMKLKGKIIKILHDHQSSSGRKIDVKYYIVDDKGLKELPVESGVRVNGKFYDVVKLNDKKVLINKDEIIIQ